MDKPLSRVDHMMWDMETPTSLVTITGIMVLDAPVNKESLAELIEKRLLRYERFHKKIIHEHGRPVWHVDEQFNLRSHIHHMALPGAGTYASLQEVVSDLMSQPLDYSKPLWQVHLIDNYREGQVVLWRLHHAIADGIALIKVVFSLTGTSREESLQAETGEPIFHPEPPRPSNWRDDLKHWYHLGNDLYREARHLISDPGQLKETLSDSWTTLKELTALFTSRSLEGNLYKGELSVSKKAAWSEPLSLERVRAIGHAQGATINDVLLSMMTGALRRHLMAHLQPVDKGLRVVCPVNIRHQDEVVKVHNKIGMLSLELPVHIADPHERISYIRDKTAELKHSWEPVVVYNLLNAVADLLPRAAEHRFADMIGERIAGVVTNVPGPRHPIYLAGAKVSDMMFWVPQTGPLGVGVSLISYDHKVYLGVVTDSRLVSDPDRIVQEFYEEFAVLDRAHPEEAGKPA